MVVARLAERLWRYCRLWYFGGRGVSAIAASDGVVVLAAAGLLGGGFAGFRRRVSIFRAWALLGDLLFGLHCVLGLCPWSKCFSLGPNLCFSFNLLPIIPCI